MPRSRTFPVSLMRVRIARIQQSSSQVPLQPLVCKVEHPRMDNSPCRHQQKRNSAIHQQLWRGYCYR